MLHVELHEPAAGGPRAGAPHRVVLVHGFTQTGASWGPIARGLAAAGFEVALVDAPGHGRSASVRADLDEGARLLGEAAGRGAYVGYSMGGRLCLHLAVARPDLVTRIATIGAHPGIEDAEERAARRRHDAELAASLRREGVEPFLERWLALALFAGLRLAPEDAEARAAQDAEGLASSLELAGTGSQRPLWDELQRLRAPVLAMAGERDARFVPLAERLAATVADGRHAVVPGTGHAAHLEQPDAVLAMLLAFLREG